MLKKRLQVAGYRRTDISSPATAPSPTQAPMAASLAQSRPAAILPDLVVLCPFSLLGLTLSAAVLSYISSETMGIMFSSVG